MFDSRKTSFTRNTDLTRKTSSDMAVLVTGSNKGIGFQILRTLARQKYRDFQGKVKFLQNLSFFSIFSRNFYSGDLILCSRSTENGEAAMKTILKEWPEAKIHVCQLDLLDKTSRENARNFIENKFGKISVLINNAGFAYKKDSNASDLAQAEDTLAVNYFGTVEFTKLMLPMVSNRVIFISSLCSDTSFGACSDGIRSKIKSGSLSCDEVDLIANDFLGKVKNGGHLNFYRVVLQNNY